MRPTLTEELATVRLVLASAIAPALGDAFAKEQLVQVIEVIDRIAATWDRVLPGLVTENRALERLLREITVGQDPVASGILPDFGETLRAALPIDSPFPDFTVIHARNLQLRAAVERLAVALPLEGGESAARLRETLAGALAANLRAALPPPPPAPRPA